MLESDAATKTTFAFYSSYVKHLRRPTGHSPRSHCQRSSSGGLPSPGAPRASARTRRPLPDPGEVQIAVASVGSDFAVDLFVDQDAQTVAIDRGLELREDVARHFDLLRGHRAGSGEQARTAQ